MKVLNTFILLIISIYSFGQTKQDTLQFLEQKAITYLNEMYAEQNFEKASLEWPDSIIVDIQDIYKKQNKQLSSNLELVENIRTDFQKFYLKNKEFSILYFNEKELDIEQNSISAYFQYSYKEKENGQSINRDSFIYFYLNKEKEKWEILDFRIPVILGDPNRWMK